MKSNIISIFCFFFALAQIPAQTSQPTRLVFQPITLTGGNAKIISEGFRPYWQLELNGGVFLNNPTDANSHTASALDQLQTSIYTSPSLFEQLYQTLGGEFFIGNPSLPTQQGGVFKKQSPVLGLNIALRLSGRLKIEGGATRFQSEVGAAFPVVVFGHQNGQPKTLQGNLRTEQEHLRAHLGSAWFFGKTTFQPFLGAGVQYSKTAASTTRANIMGVGFQVEEHPSASSLGAYGMAGLEVHPAFPLFFRVAVNTGTEKAPSVGQVEENRTVFRSNVLAGVGWRF